MDNGSEFCGGSLRRLKQCDKMLSLLGVTLETVPSGAKHLMAIIENSHRDDDEYFLIIHAEGCDNARIFLNKAQQWQDTWNFFKPSYCKGMNGFTPYRVPKFPVILMEELLRKAGIITMFLDPILGGKYVYTKCRLC